MFLIDCRYSRWRMSADLIEVSEEFPKVKESSISLEVVDENQPENQTGFLKIMTLTYKASTALFFCGTFLYFMLNEADPLSALEALTYQVTNLNTMQCDAGLIITGPVTALPALPLHPAGRVAAPAEGCGGRPQGRGLPRGHLHLPPVVGPHDPS
jgi:hypothetical protein